FVSEDIKRPLYQNAKATVLVGLYEGFGIPPLESMSVGTPAIVAKTSSLPEVVGNTGWQVDPNSSHDIAKALKLAWSTPNKSLKKQAQRVKKQASQFSWQKTGKVILKTIREVVSVKT
ncbi:MAG TPA: glycosyltransferase, partial [Patescibacteria group bacterium]